jgi:hypothetical protein
MSTRIDLQEPFCFDYSSGYLNINKEPRRVLMLVRNDGSKTSTSYARYLMSCSLGRYLSNDEHVDHIDNDKMNDVIDNLQILSQKENNQKNKQRTFIELECPICFSKFSKEARNINHKLKSGKTPTCSRRCGGKMAYKNAPVS